jgi:periplasmic copper chaperone A
MNLRKALFAFLCLLSLNTVMAQEAGSIVVTDAWARATVIAESAEATPEVGGVSGAYMTISNQSETPLVLTAVSTVAAGVAEIHETQLDNGIMQMNPIDRLEIPPGESVVLEPGGFHIMLMDLTRSLVPGDAISLTLTFEPIATSAALGIVPIELVVGVPVLDAPPPASEVIISQAWVRPTVNEIVGMDTAERPSADLGVVSPEGQGAVGDEEMHTGHGSGDQVSAAYFHLTNLGEADRLVSVMTEAAGLVEIHESQMENGIMRMNLIEGIDLEANETVILEPGGLHIMLMELERPLIPGEALTLTLTFESGKTLMVALPIYNRLLLMP